MKIKLIGTHYLKKRCEMGLPLLNFGWIPLREVGIDKGIGMKFIKIFNFDETNIVELWYYEPQYDKFLDNMEPWYYELQYDKFLDNTILLTLHKPLNNKNTL